MELFHNSLTCVNCIDKFFKYHISEKYFTVTTKQILEKYQRVYLKLKPNKIKINNHKKVVYITTLIEKIGGVDFSFTSVGGVNTFRHSPQELDINN